MTSRDSGLSPNYIRGWPSADCLPAQSEAAICLPLTEWEGSHLPVQPRMALALSHESFSVRLHVDLIFLLVFNMVLLGYLVYFPFQFICPFIEYCSYWCLAIVPFVTIHMRIVIQ